MRQVRAGWFCSYTPYEVLAAAGLAPVRLFGAGGPTPDADAVLGTNICPYVRACLEQGLAGEAPPVVVFAGCCDAMRRLRDAWERYCDPELSCAFDVPRGSSRDASRLFKAGIRRLLKELESHTGREVTAGRLAGAIRRRAVMESGLAQAAAGTLAGSASAEELVGLFMDCQAGVRAGTGPANGAENPGGTGAGAPGAAVRGPGAARVALTGNMLRREGIPAALDSLGARVAMLDLCSVERSLVWEEGPGGVDGSTVEGLLDLLADRYLQKLSCPRMLDATGAPERHDRLVEVARASGARGVVAAPLMFCDPFLYDLPRLQGRLEREGIRALVLSSDYRDEGSGQALTRLEGFLEMLRAGEAT